MDLMDISALVTGANRGIGRAIALELAERGANVHRSVRALNADIQDWTEKWNENPQPYVWTKTAEEILESLAGYCNTINASGH